MRYAFTSYPAMLSIPKTIFYIAALLLVLALAPLPYGFYTFIRLTSTLAFAALCYLAFKDREPLLGWAFGFMALVFNPLFPLYLSRPLWIAIDLTAAIAIALAGRRFGR